MSLFSNLTEVDRVLFEGHEVWKVTPKKDPSTKEVTHYVLAVFTGNDAKVRTFRPDEIRELINTERLVIDRGYYSAKRIQDRRNYGRKENLALSKKRRKAVDRKVFLAQRMEHHRDGRGNLDQWLRWIA